MIKIFKTSKEVINNINLYFDNVASGIYTFKEGVNHYLNGNISEFEINLKKIEKLEEESDLIIRKIDNDFFVYSLMPNFSSEILNLIDKTDDILDKIKDNLSQFDVESPYIPEDIKAVKSPRSARRRSPFASYAASGERCSARALILCSDAIKCR